MKKIIDRIKKELEISINKNPAQGLLFSGGLDSTILALLKPDMKAITVNLESFGDDEKFRVSQSGTLSFKNRD